jgi:hypothetical protein
VAVGVDCPVDGVLANPVLLVPVLLVGVVWPAVLGVVLGGDPAVVLLVDDGLLPVVLFDSGVLFLFSIRFLLDGYVRRELIIKNWE